MMHTSRAGGLPCGPFDLLLADPPYDYGNGRQHAGRGSLDTGGAASHYPTVSMDELMGLEVEAITASNALLFLWSTSPHFPQALALARAWGFAPREIAHVWKKPTLNPGRYTLSSVELLIGAVRGSPPLGASLRPEQLILAPRWRHSAKPPLVRNLLGMRFPQLAKIELFARDRAPGWEAWGLDAPPAA